MAFDPTMLAFNFKNFQTLKDQQRHYRLCQSFKSPLVQELESKKTFPNISTNP